MGVNDPYGQQDLEDRLSLRRSKGWYHPEGMHDPVKVDVRQTTDTPWLKFFYYIGFPFGALAATTVASAAALVGLDQVANDLLNYAYSTNEYLPAPFAAKLFGGSLGFAYAFNYVTDTWFKPENERLYITPETENGK